MPASAIFTTPLNEKARGELRKLAQLPEEKIDFSDVPALLDAPAQVEIGRFYRPVKQLISLRLDADVLAWFRSRGPRYQTYINQVLRREAEAHRSHSR
jgi:uncharacterized protein (DUF4415 family)